MIQKTCALSLEYSKKSCLIEYKADNQKGPFPGDQITLMMRSSLDCNSFKRFGTQLTKTEWLGHNRQRVETFMTPVAQS